MSIYGSYPPTSGALHKLLHAPASGLHLRGFAPSGLAVLDSARVLLAPLRYGAGLKGKVLDAWLHGMPVVTTPVGAEGLTKGDVCSGGVGAPGEGGGGAATSPTGAAWGGLYSAGDAEAFAVDAVRLHEEEALWAASREEGRRLLTELFDAPTRWVSNARIILLCSGRR